MQGGWAAPVADKGGCAVCTTNCSSTIQKVAHQEYGVIWCFCCILSHSGSVPASPDMRPVSLLSSCMHTIPNRHHAPTQPTIVTTSNTQSQTVITSSAFHAQLYRFRGSSSCVCGNKQQQQQFYS